jgi:hypothetical protein
MRELLAGECGERRPRIAPPVEVEDDVVADRLDAAERPAARRDPRLLCRVVAGRDLDDVVADVLRRRARPASPPR